MRARWAIDLSPGGRTTPRNGPDSSKLAVSGVAALS
jgi:hypothetical protein